MPRTTNTLITIIVKALQSCRYHRTDTMHKNGGRKVARQGFQLIEIDGVPVRLDRRPRQVYE